MQLCDFVLMFEIAVQPLTANWQQKFCHLPLCFCYMCN